MNTTAALHLPPMHASERWLLRACLLLPLAALVLFFGVPMLAIAWRSLVQDTGGIGWGNYAALLDTPGVWRALANSLLLGAVTTAVTLVLAFVVAFGLERTCMPGRRFVAGALALPMLAPSLVLGLGLIFLLGRNGIVGKMLGVRPEIYGFWGLLIADVLYALPQAVLIVRTALRQGDARQYDAAEVLGATPWRQFCDITAAAGPLRTSERGVCGVHHHHHRLWQRRGHWRQFCRAGHRDLQPGQRADEIWHGRGGGHAAAGARRVIGVHRTHGRTACRGRCRIGPAAHTRTQPGARHRVFHRLHGHCGQHRGPRAHGGGGQLHSAVALPAGPHTQALRHHHCRGYAPLWTSVWVSALAASVGTAMLFVLCFGIRRLPGRLAQAATALSALPVGVPGLVLGLAYVFTFNTATWPWGMLYGTAILLALCNYYHYHTQGFMTMMTGMRNVPTTLEDATTVLGGSTARVLRDVYLPALLPTLLAVLAFLFMRSMVTLSAVIFLITPSLPMGAVTVMRLDEAGLTSQAAAFSTCIMAVVGSLALLLHFGTQRRKPGSKPA